MLLLLAKPADWGGSVRLALLPGHPDWSGAARFVTLVLHPEELKRPSKTNLFDSSVPLDLGRHPNQIPWVSHGGDMSPCAARLAQDCVCRFLLGCPSLQIDHAWACVFLLLQSMLAGMNALAVIDYVCAIHPLECV